MSARTEFSICKALARARKALIFVCSSLLALFALWGAGGFGVSPARADVQDFSYDSWHVDYTLGVDSSGHSTARVTETITARFPDFKQNRGIVRGIPDRYERASIDPRNFKVTDENGDDVPFNVKHDDGFTAVLTGGYNYVFGQNTYVIEYQLSDVVMTRKDGTADEFYWDIMDFVHEQPVDSFSASVHFNDALSPELNGNARCYTGMARSTTECAATFTPSTSTWNFNAGKLAPREGVTVAIGLAPESVVQPATRIPNFALDTLPILLTGLALALGIASVVYNSKMRRRRRTARGTIIAQYDVPDFLPPLIAGALTEKSEHLVPAQLIHLAVNGAIRIEDTKPKPTLHLLDLMRAPDQIDKETLGNLFEKDLSGSPFKLPEKDEKFSGKMTKLQSRAAKIALERGYLEKAHSPTARIYGIIGIVAAATGIALAIVALNSRESVTPIFPILLGVAAIICGLVGATPKKMHTPSGAEAREHLLGVREFIRVAEADRLQMLQSYAGAQRIQLDGRMIVHIYERLLPYAMIFGLEKKWGRVLQTQYKHTTEYQPTWMTGTGLGIMSVQRLGSSISSFTSAAEASASYSSSSDGGSGGGGFSGGGGGGGFSGGR